MAHCIRMFARPLPTFGPSGDFCGLPPQSSALGRSGSLSLWRCCSPALFDDLAPRRSFSPSLRDLRCTVAPLLSRPSARSFPGSRPLWRWTISALFTIWPLKCSAALPLQFSVVWTFQHSAAPVLGCFVALSSSGARPVQPSTSLVRRPINPSLVVLASVTLILGPSGHRPLRRSPCPVVGYSGLGACALCSLALALRLPGTRPFRCLAASDLPGDRPL